MAFSVFSISSTQKPGRSGNKMANTKGDSFLHKWKIDGFSLIFFPFFRMETFALTPCILEEDRSNS